MSDVSMQQKKNHPHKFSMWLALAGMIMMFAGLTSAYVVKRSQAGWEAFTLPSIFMWSTVVILISSLTMQLSVKAFKQRNIGKYRLFLIATGILGTLFMVMQIIGFGQFEAAGMKMTGIGSNPASSFVLAIAGLHIVHVLGGVVALWIIFMKAFSKKTKQFNAVPVEVLSTYWHFVDILWIYLFVFLSLLH